MYETTNSNTGVLTDDQASVLYSETEGAKVNFNAKVPSIKLTHASVEYYVQALKQLLTETLVSAERDLIDTVFIRLVWTLTDTSVEVHHALDICQVVSTKLIESLQGSLSEIVTHACLIVM